MTATAENIAIEQRFNTSWATRTPIDWDNVDYKPVTGTSWVRFRILGGFGQQMSTGAVPLHRNTGILDIAIFTKLGIGTDTAKGHADFAMAIFRGWQSGGITCRTPYVTRAGEASGWYQLNVTVPFFRNEYIAL
jgi:hypothetical protein